MESLKSSMSQLAPQPAQSWQDWLTPGRFALLLGAMIFAAFPQVALGLHSFVYRDFGVFGYPLAHYHRESFWRGEIPLWNPYNNFGIPFLAQWATMALYPPSLIYLLLPLPWSASLFCLLHLFFGGMGMYVLARGWTGNPFAAGLAGIGFAFNGFTLNCLMWLHYTASLAWMPWVVWAVLRASREGGRWIIYAALAGAMQMLSGGPEVILFTWVLLAGLFWCEAGGDWRCVRARAWRVALIVALTASLSAAQLLPFFELLSHSTRGSDFSHGEWRIPPWGWANIFVPLFRTDRSGAGVHFQDEQAFTSSYYPGLALIGLAMIALLWRRQRRVWLLWSAVLVSVLLAMGPHTPLYELLRKVFPHVGFMRYPVKFLLIPLFAWPLLAAFGWTALAQRRIVGNEVTSLQSKCVKPPVETRYLVSYPLAVAAVLVLVVSGIVVFAKMAPYPREDWACTLENGVVRVALLALTAGLAGWLLRRRDSRPIGAVAILLLVWFDFLQHSPPQNPTTVLHAYTARPPHLEQMQPRPRLGQSRALLSLTAMERFHKPGTSNLTETYFVHRSGLFANCNLIDGIPTADGFFPLYLRQERDIHFRLYESDNDPRAALGRFVGLSQVSGTSNLLAWQPRSDFLPLITAGQRPAFADRDATLAGLIATNFVPEQVVYLPLEAQTQVRVDTPGAVRVISTRIGHHQIEAQVEATAPSLVVVAQSHYPSWRAYIDGEPARLWRANHAFQALYVPPGRHAIRWVCRDAQFLLGALISVGALGGCGAALCRRRGNESQLGGFTHLLWRLVTSSPTKRVPENVRVVP